MFYGITEDKQLVAANHATKDTTYYCPQCKKKLILRQGVHNLPHFAHLKKGCLLFSEGETAEHLQGKNFLLNFFRNIMNMLNLRRILVS